MSDIDEECDEELTKGQEDLIGRLINWKFGSALNYRNALKKKSSLECLESLHEMWGNTGWGDGKFSEILYYLVEFIRMSEGYTREEFYGDDDEESDSDACKRCKSRDMKDLSGEEECNEFLTEDRYKELRVNIKKDMITRFKACNNCGLVYSLRVVRRQV